MKQLPDDLLVLTDKMTMAASSNAVPFPITGSSSSPADSVNLDSRSPAHIPAAPWRGLLPANILDARSAVWRTAGLVAQERAGAAHRCLLGPEPVRREVAAPAASPDIACTNAPGQTDAASDQLELWCRI
jgi:hypothetical protein